MFDLVSMTAIGYAAHLLVRNQQVRHAEKHGEARDDEVIGAIDVRLQDPSVIWPELARCKYVLGIARVKQDQARYSLR